MPNNNNNNSEEIKKVLQKIGLLGKELEALMMPGQTIIMDVKAGNVVDIRGQRPSNILIINKPTVIVSVNVD